jgi:DNA-binding MurR/RpiR family transcriptional regulator
VIQQAGLTGFQQLKLALARNLGSPTLPIHEDLAIGDDYRTITRKIFSASIQALVDTEEVLTPEALEAAVEILDAATVIDIYGIGSAAPIAENAYYGLLRIGLTPRISTDSHLQVTTAALATRRTAVLTISHSGSTRETLDATEVAHKAGAKVVIISGYADAPLHKFADVVLRTQAIETKFRTEAMTSRIAQLAIVDTLIGALALKRHKSALKTLEKTFEALSLKRV